MPSCRRLACRTTCLAESVMPLELCATSTKVCHSVLLAALVLILALSVFFFSVELLYTLSYLSQDELALLLHL